MEEGKWQETKEGTPQGSVISPILANVYLHYVLDVWAQVWQKKVARGEMILVRYADDAVLGFQYRKDAERFLEQLRERVGKFGLELHPEKTRLIEFGRFAATDRKKRGEGKPETFDFSGFTHICGTNKKGRYIVRRKTIGKRMAARLKQVRQELHRRMHDAVGDTVKWLQSVYRGYAQYHAVPGNGQRMRTFWKDMMRSWLRELRRRSQRTRWTWERFQEKFASQIPIIGVLHPYPEDRFAERIRGGNRVR
jgi:hypothetical protein